MGRQGNTSTAHVVITMEGKQAHHVMNMLKEQVAKTRKELEQMEKTMAKGGAVDLKAYEKKAEDLKTMERAVKQNKNAYIDLDRTVKNLSGTTLRDLQKNLKECRKQMQNLTADDPKMKKLVAQYRAIDNQIGQITGQWKRQDGAIKQVAARLAAYVSVYGAFNFIKNKIQSLTKENLKLADSMGDIMKVTGMSFDDVGALSDKLHSLDTRTASEDLHKLAYEAGRLGVKGVDDIYQFVKAGNQIKVALGEDLGDDALVSLMKMNEVMGITKRVGIEKALLSTGSAINTLAASSTASGGQIADFTSRLSGIATAAKMSMDELLALGSASSSLNLQVEVSATAFNKFISQIVAETDKVADAAGVERDLLNDLVDSGKTMEAVIVTLEGLSKKGGLKELSPIMGDLGSEGARMNQIITAFTNNIPTLKAHLETSTKAYAEATSVTKEYNVKNENAAALLARMGNAIKENFINAGMVKWLENFLRSLFEIPKAVEENKTAIIAALSAISLALLNMKIQLTSFTKVGLLRILVTLKGGFASLAMVVKSSLMPAVKSLFGFMAAHPFLAVATALSVFIGVCYDSYRRMDLMGKAQKRLNDLSKDYQTELGKETTHINQLFSWLNKAKKGTTDYLDAKKAILDNYGKYLKGLGDEIEALEDVEGAYKAITKAALDATKARMAEKGLSAANEAYASTTGEEYTKIYKKLSADKDMSPEQVESFMSRLRTIIDMGKTMPADMQAVIDSFEGVRSYTGSAGVKVDVKENLVQGWVLNLRGAKKALDKEIAEIEIKYGKLKDLLAEGEEDNGNGGGGTEPDPDPKPDPDPDDLKAKALKAAKNEHDAVMSAIEVYYKMEQQVVNEQYLKGEIAAAEHEQKLAEIEDRGMNTRIAARKALLGRDGASEEWLAELNKMDKEALSITDETQQAMLNLRGKNLSAIGAALRKFGDGEMDGIWKKMEEDRVKGQEQQIKMQKEVEAILLKYDYTGKVTDQFLASMQKLGYFKSEITNEAGEIVSLSRAQLESEFEKLYTIYNDLFSIDIATPEGIEDFRKALQGLGLTSVDTSKLTSEQLMFLYDKTVEYGDAMVEAEEKARKRQLKISDALYKRTPQYKQDKAREDTEKETKDVYKYAQQLGLASDIMVQDQEVKLFEARLEAAKNYYEYLKSTGADTTKAELELQEATAKLASAIAGQIKEKLDVLRSYGDNFEQFGTDFGEAMFGSLDDRQEALESFVRAVGKSTQELIMNWVKQKIEHAILRKAMVKMEGQAQKQMTGAVKEGQEQESAIMQTGGEMQKSITTQVGAQLTQQKNKQASESVAASAKETQAEGTLGIAQGAAKTIGKLGWWGIPLVAVITALINGLLSAAMSKVGSLFGGSSADAGAVATPKLVTGMLTYDSGNVQSVLGDNGSVYSARIGGVSGTGLVSVPTLTNVGGQAALVGEEGPEIVIGRATTRALQQDNSGLLQGLIHFDRLHSGRGFRRFDSGNIGAFGGATNDETTARMLDAVILALTPTLAGVQESLQASAQANLALRDRLNKPIQSVINKNGRGGLIDEVATGLEQEKRMGRSEVVKRLFRQ